MKNPIIAICMACFALLMTSMLLASDKPELKFNSDGTFKIVQFTDIHWNPDSDDSWVKGKNQAEVNWKTMGTILDAEKPNLVVITGDVLFRKKEYNEEDLKNAFKPIIDRNIPWAFVLGNHDHEYSIDPVKTISFCSNLPYSLTEQGSSELGCAGNYILEIKSSKYNKTECLLYMIDSHQDSPLLNKEGKNDGYDWIHLDQISWYTKQSAEFTKANNNKPLPALMFFHIPLPEYQQVWENSKVCGNKLEKECCPKLNSGLFCAVCTMKDVMGIFAGHDHVNDYIGYLNGVALAYGRKTGLTCYGPMPLEKGSRVILIKEGKREFDTWIRTESGKVESPVDFPEFFQK